MARQRRVLTRAEHLAHVATSAHPQGEQGGDTPSRVASVRPSTHPRRGKGKRSRRRRAGKAIGQSAEPEAGPGQILKLLIARVTGQKPAPNCRCLSRARQMNAWGWWGCWKRRDTIMQWLVEEARKRNVKVDKATLSSLVRTAFREYRQQRCGAPQERAGGLQDQPKSKR